MDKDKIKEIFSRHTYEDGLYIYQRKYVKEPEYLLEEYKRFKSWKSYESGDITADELMLEVMYDQPKLIKVSSLFNSEGDVPSHKYEFTCLDSQHEHLTRLEILCGVQPKNSLYKNMMKQVEFKSHVVTYGNKGIDGNKGIREFTEEYTSLFWRPLDVDKLHSKGNDRIMFVFANEINMFKRTIDGYVSSLTNGKVILPTHLNERDIVLEFIKTFKVNPILVSRIKQYSKDGRVDVEVNALKELKHQMIFVKILEYYHKYHNCTLDNFSYNKYIRGSGVTSYFYKQETIYMKRITDTFSKVEEIVDMVNKYNMFLKDKIYLDKQRDDNILKYEVEMRKKLAKESEAYEKLKKKISKENFRRRNSGDVTDYYHDNLTSDDGFDSMVELVTSIVNKTVTRAKMEFDPNGEILEGRGFVT